MKTLQGWIKGQIKYIVCKSKYMNAAIAKELERCLNRHEARWGILG